MWANIQDWPYQVSTKGKVRRIGSPALSPSSDRGYPVVTLSDGRRRMKVMVHVLVATAFHGKKPSAKHQVAHWDGNKANNHVENLRWALPIENDDDKKRHGTHAKGERIVQSKLSEKDIRRILLDPRSAHELADIYKVHHSTISRARGNSIWKHINKTGQPTRRKSGKYTKIDRQYIDDVLTKLEAA